MRIIIFDKKPGPGIDQWFLMLTWLVGSYIQKLFGVADVVKGFSSWDEVSSWLQTLNAEKISSIQYWGHGSPGKVWMAQKTMPHSLFQPIKEKLSSDSIIWFRTCSTLQGQKGYDLSKHLANSLNCIIAGHTRIIGLLQGGLHTRKPNEEPSWPINEAEFKSSVIPSWLKWGNNTITCFHTKIPKGW